MTLCSLLSGVSTQRAPLESTCVNTTRSPKQQLEGMLLTIPTKERHRCAYSCCLYVCAPSRRRVPRLRANFASCWILLCLANFLSFLPLRGYPSASLGKQEPGSLGGILLACSSKPSTNLRLREQKDWRISCCYQVLFKARQRCRRVSMLSSPRTTAKSPMGPAPRIAALLLLLVVLAAFVWEAHARMMTSLDLNR